MPEKPLLLMLPPKTVAGSTTTFPVIRIALLLFFVTATASAVPPERATYDGAGKLTSLIQGGAKLGVQTRLTVNFEGGVEADMQPDGQSSPIQRDSVEPQWHGTVHFPNGGSASLAVSWVNRDDGVTLAGALTAETALDVQSVDCIVDVPRTEFAGGRLLPMEADLPVAKPAQVTFFRGTVDTLTFRDATGKRTLSLKLDQARPVTVTDRWDADGRSYRVRFTLRTGTWARGEALKPGLTLRATGEASVAPVRLSVNPDAPRYPFDGYGANVCWGDDPKVTSYLLDHLHAAWTRHELKVIDWERERNTPGGGLVQDFEWMRRTQRAGTPWILSVWHLPQRFYRDANQRPPGSFGRTIASERWDELLELFGSYLVYLKEHYGAEPDLFSFNEPDLGVDVGFTPDAHRDAIRRIGAHLASLGLKTKLLLGDTANPRDTHRYVLTTAADTEAMRYVGAVSFHSWGNGTPAQYAAWADVAAWLRVPLLVGEAGVNPDYYRNHTFDSYDYGLAEAAQQQEVLRHAHPAASLFWQFTTDYGLARLKHDGTVEPTGRFWLMKHFTDLTPVKSQVLTSASDQTDVLVSAFVRGVDVTVHVLNFGPARDAAIAGLPTGEWRVVTTTEKHPI